jgi:hypothetical protein
MLMTSPILTYRNRGSFELLDFLYYSGKGKIFRGVSWYNVSVCYFLFSPFARKRKRVIELYIEEAEKPFRNKGLSEFFNVVSPTLPAPFRSKPGDFGREIGQLPPGISLGHLGAALPSLRDSKDALPLSDPPTARNGLRPHHGVLPSQVATQTGPSLENMTVIVMYFDDVVVLRS